MKGAGQSLVTVDEYRALPEEGPHYQLIEGELIMAAAPRRYHQEISRNLEYLLMRYLEERPVGKLFHAPFDVVLSQYDVLQPDICIYLNENLDRLTDLGSDGSPDFVVEILSPGNAALDRGPKLRLYAAHGVQETWIIEPESKTIEVLQRSGNELILKSRHDAEDTLDSDLFPGLRVNAARIFEP